MKFVYVLKKVHGIIIITLHHRDGTLEKNMERSMLMHITVTITASTVLVQALHSPVITDVRTRIIITIRKRSWPLELISLLECRP